METVKPINIQKLWIPIGSVVAVLTTVVYFVVLVQSERNLIHQRINKLDNAVINLTNSLTKLSEVINFKSTDKFTARDWEIACLKLEILNKGNFKCMYSSDK